MALFGNGVKVEVSVVKMRSRLEWRGLLIQYDWGWPIRRDLDKDTKGRGPCGKAEATGAALVPAKEHLGLPEAGRGRNRVSPGRLVAGMAQ